jgi:Protein of unknown function (DUF1257)
MSHYSTGSVSLSCPEATAAALRELGFVVEVHAVPQPLYGYKGDRRPEKAHVIIRREHVGSAANDIGFLFGPDAPPTPIVTDIIATRFGKYKGNATAIISEFDQSQGYNADWLKKVTVLQAVHKATALLTKQGKRFERRTNKIGQPVLRVYA